MRYSHYSQNWLSLSSRLRFAVFLVCLFLILICWRFSTFFHPNLCGQTWTIMLIVISVTVGADVSVLKKHRKGRKKNGLGERKWQKSCSWGSFLCLCKFVKSSLFTKAHPITFPFFFFSHLWKLHFSFLRLLTSSCHYQPSLPSFLQRERLWWWPIKSCGILSLDPLTLQWFDPPVRNQRPTAQPGQKCGGGCKGLHTSVHLPCTASLCSCRKSAFW